MNGVPMKLDYSKTINEQLPTFDYYKDRYCSYALELINDRKEIERLNNIINETLNLLKNYENDNEANRYGPIKEAIEILEGAIK